MADIDSFVNVNDQDADPAAEFLAREQDALAGLDDDFDFDNKVNNKNNVNGGLIGDQDFNGDTGLTEVLNGLDLNGPDPEIITSGDSSTTEQSSGLKSGNVNSSSPSIPAVEKPEPEKIRVWREEQKRLLEQKDEEEAKKKEELRLQAKRELEEWYSRYSEQLEKSKQANRNAEKEWIAERDQEAPGQEWEKIARMCDFNPKAARNTKDTARMRSILLQLKQAPPIKSNKSNSSTAAS